jgi:hypothetical protein
LGKQRGFFYTQRSRRLALFLSALNRFKTRVTFTNNVEAAFTFDDATIRMAVFG